MVPDYRTDTVSIPYIVAVWRLYFSYLRLLFSACFIGPHSRPNSEPLIVDVQEESLFSTPLLVLRNLFASRFTTYQMIG